MGLDVSFSLHRKGQTEPLAQTENIRSLSYLVLKYFIPVITGEDNQFNHELSYAQFMFYKDKVNDLQRKLRNPLYVDVVEAESYFSTRYMFMPKPQLSELIGNMFPGYNNDQHAMNIEAFLNDITDQLRVINYAVFNLDSEEDSLNKEDLSVHFFGWR